MTLRKASPRWPYSSQPPLPFAFLILQSTLCTERINRAPSPEGNDNISQVILLDHGEMPQMICHLGKLLDSTSFFFKIGLFHKEPFSYQI